MVSVLLFFMVVAALAVATTALAVAKRPHLLLDRRFRTFFQISFGLIVLTTMAILLAIFSMEEATLANRIGCVAAFLGSLLMFAFARHRFL